jgi:hypothetical protein
VLFHAAVFCTLIALEPYQTGEPTSKLRPLSIESVRVAVAKKIRGVTFEENLNNSMGLEYYRLSHRFGNQTPNWPYF